MYLDTDIILAMVKEADWLKPHINFKKLEEPKTSVLALLEAELVMDREFGRGLATKVLETVKSYRIDILPLTNDVLEKSAELLDKHGSLNIFDSVHAAFSIFHNETIVSTDHIFRKIPGIRQIDPRDL